MPGEGQTPFSTGCVTRDADSRRALLGSLDLDEVVEERCTSAEVSQAG